jgi:isochorismate hydrolase
MKEKYYSIDTLDSQAKSFLDEVRHLRELHRWNIEPKRAALLVLDMQRYFLDERSHAYIPSAPAIVPKIRRLQQLFLMKDMTVFHTRHINTEKNAGRLKDWWRDVIRKNNDLSEIIGELRDVNIGVLVKSQYDAFFDTNLELLLKNEGIEQVLIAGVMTHLCCETTARSAFIRGFEVYFIIDGTATYRKDFHQSSLRNLSHGFAVPVLTREIEDILSGTSS